MKLTDKQFFQVNEEISNLHIKEACIVLEKLGFNVRSDKSDPLRAFVYGEDLKTPLYTLDELMDDDGEGGSGDTFLFIA